MDIELNAMELIEIDPTLALRPDYDSSVSHRTLSELCPSDIAFCLRQSIAVPQVAELALNLASDNPLLNAEFYEGDLLMSLLHAAKNKLLSVQQLAELRDVCSDAVITAEAVVENVVPTAASFASDYDGL
jgi:CDI immunity proteins